MLNDIALFVQIVRSGSLSKASKKLSIPANTLSRRLTSLEKRLGTSLVLRSTRALRCTTDGERLFEQCSGSVDSLQDRIASLQSAIAGVIGKARIQIPSSFFDCFCGDFIYTLLKTHPGLEIEVIVSDEEPNLVQDGIDLLLHFGELKRSTYIARKLCNSTLGLYASGDYLMTRGAPQRPEDLGSHSCIHSTGKGSIVIRRHDGSDFHDIAIRTRFSSKSTPALINAAEQGLGIAFINPQCARARGASLVRVLPDYVAEGEPLFAAYSSHHSLSGCARAVMDYVIARASEFYAY